MVVVSWWRCIIQLCSLKDQSMSSIRFLLAVPLILQLVSVTQAERIDICSRQTFSQASGTVCSFDTYPGEDIKVWARYRDASPDYARV